MPVFWTVRWSVTGWPRPTLSSSAVCVERQLRRPGREHRHVHGVRALRRSGTGRRSPWPWPTTSRGRRGRRWCSSQSTTTVAPTARSARGSVHPATLTSAPVISTFPSLWTVVWRWIDVADGDHRLVRGQGDLDAGVRRLRAAGVEADVVDEPAVVGSPHLVLAHAEAEADGLPGEGEQFGPAGDVPVAGPDEGRLAGQGILAAADEGAVVAVGGGAGEQGAEVGPGRAVVRRVLDDAPVPVRPRCSSRTRRRGGSGGTAVLPAGRATLWVMCTRRSDVAPEVGPVQAVRRRWWRTRHRPRTGRTSGRTRSGRG